MLPTYFNDRVISHALPGPNAPWVLLNTSVSAVERSNISLNAESPLWNGGEQGRASAPGSFPLATTVDQMLTLSINRFVHGPTKLIHELSIVTCHRPRIATAAVAHSEQPRKPPCHHLLAE